MSIRSQIPGDDDPVMYFPEDYRTMSLFEIFEDSDLMEDISDRNIELVDIISTPEKSKEIVEILLNLSSSDDLFKMYKAPYLAANCFAIFPEKRMNEVLEDGSFLDQVFDFIFSDSISDLYLGLFDCIFDGIVRKSSLILYNYLSKHSEDLVPRFASHMNRLTIVNIIRYLLDLPIINNQPWWNNSQIFLDYFISYLDKEESSSGVTLFFVSVIQRGTSIPSDSIPFASSSLIPMLIDSSMINTLFAIITSSSNDLVISNTLSILSRLLWTEIPEMDYGLGGYDGILDKRLLYTSWKNMGVLNPEAIKDTSAEICSHLDDLLNMLTTSLKKEPEKRNGLSENGAIPLCPKSVMGTVVLLVHLIDVCSESELELIMKRNIIELLITAVKKYYYCSILHVTVVQLFKTLLSKPSTIELIPHLVYGFINEAFDSSNYCLRHLSHELGKALATNETLSIDKLSDSVKLILTRVEEIPDQKLIMNEMEVNEIPLPSFIPERMLNTDEDAYPDVDDVPCELDDIDPSKLPDMDEDSLRTESIHSMDLAVSDELKDEVGDGDVDIDFDMIPDDPPLNESFPLPPEDREFSPSTTEMFPPLLERFPGSVKEHNNKGLSSSIVLDEIQDVVYLDDVISQRNDLLNEEEDVPSNDFDQIDVDSLPFCIVNEVDPTEEDFSQLDKLPA